jgi:hypothetical protein
MSRADACHEGNYEVMRGMLAAQRAGEKAERESGAKQVGASVG